MYTVILAALARKFEAFANEVKALVAKAKADVEAIEAKAEAEVKALREELVTKIAGL